MLEPPQPDRYTVIRPVQPNTFAPWLANFRAANPDGQMASVTADAVYALPTKMIGCLAAAAPGHRPFFDARQAAVETAFTELCSKRVAVGAIRNAFVCGTPLDPRPPRTTVARWGNFPEGFDWAPRAVAVLAGHRERFDEAADRMKGYVGWLLTEPAFLTEVSHLRSVWSALPANFRPDPPFYRPSRLPTAAEVGPGEPKFNGPPAHEFAEGLVALLDKWNLRGLAT